MWRMMTWALGVIKHAKCFIQFKIKQYILHIIYLSRICQINAVKLNFLGGQSSISVRWLSVEYVGRVDHRMNVVDWHGTDN